LDEIFDFLNSVMPVRLLVGVPKHQLIEKLEISAKETFLVLWVFRVGSIMNRLKRRLC